MNFKNHGKLYITCIILLLLTLAINTAYAGAARNVILMIGDGMSYQHVNAGSYYLNGTAGTLCFEPYHKCGVRTSCLDSTAHPITDSAAAASAIATGHKVNYLSISQSPTGTPYQTILELAKVMGKRTGLVGTDPITRAAPAAFAAHDSDRNNLIAIGDDYLNSSRPDVLMGGGGTASGGSKFFSTSQIAAARTLGYQTVYTKAEMDALSTSANRVLGLFSTEDMTYEHDRPVGTTEPHLSEMTGKALSLLDTDPDGFFLMIEGAKIDYAAHANDIIRTTKEVIEFNNSVQVVLNWMQGRTDTLLIVTGDHETGGLTAANAGKGNFANATWSSNDHTGANVPLYAYGSNAELVNDYIKDGTMDNTDIYKIMSRAFNPVSGSIPYLIYQQFGIGTGGHGNIYYGGGVFDGTFYTGQITQGAQQWGDEQINGTALMNTTPVGYAPPDGPGNIAKTSLPLGGYIYMVNGGGEIYRTPNWSTNPVRVPTPVIAECICTDGTYIYMTSGTESEYNKIHKWIVDHNAGTITEEPGWPVTVEGSVRFRGVSYYDGKLYVANYKTEGQVYEVDAATGAVTQIAAVPTAASNHYQAVRYGDKIFMIGGDGILYTFQLSGSTWTLASTDDLNAILGDTDCYGIGVKGDGTNAKYAWITHWPGKICFLDLYPTFTPGSIADARKGKNGYPVRVENAVVTMIGADGFWAEDESRAAGVHVLWNGAMPEVNSKVNINGGIRTALSGEKELGAISVDPTSEHYTIEPLFVTHKSIGPATGSTGLANDGLLVTVCGKGTGSDDYEFKAFYIDDGSGVASDPTKTGVKVVLPPNEFLYNTNNGDLLMYGQSCYVKVTGVVRLEKLDDGTVIRRIDARSSYDVIIDPL